MNNNIIAFSSVFAVILGFSANAFAAPVGPYVFVGAGGDYLANSKLKNTVITRTMPRPSDFHFSIDNSQQGSFGYVGHAAVGYYFNNDPDYNTRAYGVEAGFNYFGPSKSSVTNSYANPFNSSIKYDVNTEAKTNAWEAEVDGIFSQDLKIQNLSLILKLGAGYLHSQTTFTNTGDGVPNQLPTQTTIKNSGFGLAGGAGLQYNFSQHVGARVEFDGLKGGKGIGYGQAIAGLVFSFE